MDLRTQLEASLGAAYTFERELGGGGMSLRLPVARTVARCSTEGDGPYLAPVYNRLGELYEGKGDRANAASYYSRFVELRTGADPEPQSRVREVRARLVRSTDAERR